MGNNHCHVENDTQCTVKVITGERDVKGITSKNVNELFDSSSHVINPEKEETFSYGNCSTVTLTVLLDGPDFKKVTQFKNSDDKSKWKVTFDYVKRTDADCQHDFEYVRDITSQYI